MAPPERLRLRYELQAFTIDFWHLVDFNGAEGAAAYYLDDAVFATSVREYRGRDQLEAFYARRRIQAPRISVHTLSNFRIEPESDSRVRCLYMLGLYAADGGPVLPSRAAVMLGTVEEVVQRSGDSWRYVSRHVQPMFSDGTTTRG
jgi:hypothetical protein